MCTLDCIHVCVKPDVKEHTVDGLCLFFVLNPQKNVFTQHEVNRTSVREN